MEYCRRQKRFFQSAGIFAGTDQSYCGSRKTLGFFQCLGKRQTFIQTLSQLRKQNSYGTVLILTQQIAAFCCADAGMK